MDEKTVWAMLNESEEAKILLSPIGAQGFILGRGNQQISPRIVRKVGIRNIIVVATPHKLRETPTLYIDSGDSELDREFGDSVQVVSGYRMAQRKSIY
jgi:predicted polyphosphate/ATP-dependent NAD kinase